MKIAIISRPEIGSPRVLAETLNHFIRSVGRESDVFFKAKSIRRLLRSNKVGYNALLWTLYKLVYWVNDRLFFNKMKKYDVVILCDWTPNGFYKDSYDIQRFREIVGEKPLMYYAVQYLGNSPTQVEKLKREGHPLFERYDYHLAVSEVTEIRQKPAPPWNAIGLYLKSTGLKPNKKEKLIALVDFERKGYEHFREEQIRVLEELNIPYISLEGKYQIEEIREIYKKTSLYFIQFPEAFGLPIAECLACGNYVFTPDSGWPMAWRLDESPQVHGAGTLSECFVVYNDRKELKNRILTIKESWDPENTPQKVFSMFIQDYPQYYYGDPEALKQVLDKVEKGEL